MTVVLPGGAEVNRLVGSVAVYHGFLWAMRVVYTDEEEYKQILNGFDQEGWVSSRETVLALRVIAELGRRGNIADRHNLYTTVPSFRKSSIFDLLPQELER